MKRISKIIITSIIFIAIIFFIYIIFVRGIISVKLNSIKIMNLFEGDSAQDYCDSYDISKEQANDIIKNPNNYRLIIYNFNLKNELLFNKLSCVEFNTVSDSKQEKNVLGCTKVQESPIYLEPNEPYGEAITALVKVDGRSDKEQWC